MLTLTFRFSAEHETLRASVETVLILSGLLSAWFMWVRATRTRQVSDFLLSGAVLTLTLTHFVFLAGPEMLGSHFWAYGATVPLIAH